MNKLSLFAVFAFTGLAACSADLAGTYKDRQGVTTYTFESDGRAAVSVLGTTVAAEYKLDGDKVLLTSPQGTVVLTRHGKSLLGPMGLELIRQAE